jgi:hypothetical protein
MSSYDDDTALWMHSLFSDVSGSLNEKLVSPPTSLYPYRAYIETLLSYGPAVKESQLTGVIWYKDTPGHQDKRTDNKGLGFFVIVAFKALLSTHHMISLFGNWPKNMLSCM